MSCYSIVQISVELSELFIHSESVAGSGADLLIHTGTKSEKNKEDS
jgi:hypothetical protein